jgi:hypothetical protein
MNTRLGIAVVWMIGAAAPMAAATLFPQPMHLVRRLDDPISRAQTTVHEYCIGNRLISVNGTNVAIADYDKQQLIEIDRKAGTYSITRFDEIAKARRAQRGAIGNVEAARTNRLPGGEGDDWQPAALGVKTFGSGRAHEAYELKRENGGEKRTIEVGIDRRYPLSRDAVEVLVGAAYPNERTPEHDAVLSAAGGLRAGLQASDVRAADVTYALPAEQSMTFEIAGQTLTVHNSILSVTSEAPPDSVMQIPPGAKLVESGLTRLARELRELDEIPGMPAEKR